MTNRDHPVRAARRLAPGGLLALAAGAIVLTASGIGAQHNTQASELNVLLDRMRGTDPLVCRLVNRALENQWRDNAVDILEPADADAGTFHWAQSAPIEADLVPSLRRALDSDDACVQRTAAQLLGRARVDNLADLLREDLASADATIGTAALRAIGYRGQASGGQAATAALRDASEEVRVTAVWALGRIENEAAIPALTELLSNDASPRIRRAAAWALGRIAG